VPLDPHFPQDRLDLLLGAARARVLLTQEHLAKRFTESAMTVLDLEASWECPSGGRQTSPASGVTADNLAYVIYTSGSTGQAKGVMISHRAVCNGLCWLQETYHLSGEDAVLQKAPFTFDLSVWELFGPLLAGARLSVARPGEYSDCAYLVQLITEQE